MGRGYDGGMYILKSTNLVKSYDKRVVVDQVSYDVSQGEVVGLLGRNGAGKTTSFRMTIGMVTPEGGSVIFNGEDVTGLPMYKRCQMGMGYLSQKRSLFGKMSAEQNLMAILETVPMTRGERKMRASELLSKFGLSDRAKKPEAGKLSGGEQRKLEIARALVTKPALLLLDEPFAAVDPVSVGDLQEEIRRIRDEEGISILMTDHNVQQTLQICDRAYIIDEGKVLRDGTPKELINDDLVKRTYLGDTFRGDEFD